MGLVKPIDPFQGEPPSAPIDYGTSGANSPHTPPPDTARAMAGLDATYRLAFVAMEVPALPVPVRVGRVSITQHNGPIWTQHTYIKQRPGWIPHYDKTMHQGYLEVGNGLFLTLAQLPVTIPRDEHLARSFSLWRDEVRAAVSVVVALLDERLAQEEVLEDLIVNPDDPAKKGSVDIGRHVRRFLPTKRFLSWQRDTFDGLQDIDLGLDDPALPAARWYLRAAQLGPTPDAIVFLSVALEALTPPRRRGDKRSDVKRIEAALKDAGVPVEDLDPSMGRLAGLRADVVHRGMEQPDLLNLGFYQLEMLVRQLLRHRFGIWQGTWPLNPGEGTLIPSLQAAERAALDKATTTIRRVDDTQLGDRGIDAQPGG